MAISKTTITRVRAASVVKRTSPTRAKHRHPVEWGYYESGRRAVVRAVGRFAQDLPGDHLRGLRDAIGDLRQVVKAFDSTRHIADADRRLVLLSMCALVARQLILQADNDMEAALAMSPWLREAIARVDARMGKGADQ